MLVSSTTDERMLGIPVDIMLKEYARDIVSSKVVRTTDVANHLHMNSADSSNGRRNLRGFETVGRSKVNGYLSMAQFVKSALILLSPSAVSEARRLAEAASPMMFEPDPNYVMRGIIQSAASGKNTEWIPMVQAGQSDDMEGTKRRNLRGQSYGDANIVSSIRIRDINDRIKRMLV